MSINKIKRALTELYCEQNADDSLYRVAVALSPWSCA